MADKINDSEDFLAKWLSGELTESEREQFERSEEGASFKSIIDSVEKVALPAYNVEHELSRLKEKRSASVEPETKVIRFPYLFKYAAAAVLIVGISLVYFLTRTNYTTYETLAGQIESITLPDQSVVTLNGNSRLRFDPDGFDEDRQLLLEGEAFFEVTKGVNFEVKTDQGTVKVLGTSFNIWNRNNLLDVVCYTGKVNVSKESFTRDLIPGNGLRIINGAFNRSWTKNTNEEGPPWISLGITSLEEVTIKEALDELTNVFDIKVKSTKQINTIPFTGNFPNDDLTSAIELVLGADNIDYQYDAAKKELVLLGIKGQ